MLEVELSYLRPHSLLYITNMAVAETGLQWYSDTVDFMSHRSVSEVT